MPAAILFQEPLFAARVATSRDRDSTTSMRLWVHLNSLGERQFWLEWGSRLKSDRQKEEQLWMQLPQEQEVLF